MIDPREGGALKIVLTLGGPGAIATTPLGFEVGVMAEATVLADDAPPPPEPVDFGDSDSAALCEVGVVTGVCATEFLREDFFDDLVDAAPTDVFPVPRLRFLMTSVLSDSGRTTPCSFKKRPHALHNGWPSGLRLHKGVVWVKQFVQVVGTLHSPGFVAPGLWGREGAAEVYPDSGGEFGDDIGRACMPCCIRPAAFGVELVRGIFCRRGSFPRLRMSLTEAAEPCVRPRLAPGLQ